MKQITKMNFKNKRVFIRCDFNIPLHNGKITSDLRVRSALETIKFVLKQNPRQIILASHLGRPDGFDKKLSLVPIAKLLSSYLNKTVYFHANILAPVESDEKIVLLENLRFWEGEKKGSKSFAKVLSLHADVYINDAFGVAHRKDSSVFALPKLFKERTYGFLIKKELEEVSLNHPKPIVVLFGAAKLKDKIPLLKHLLEDVDKVLLAGGVSFTFLKALDIEVGKSLVEESMIDEAKKLISKYGNKIIFPVDFITASPSSLKLSASERKKKTSVVDIEKIPKSKACYDIGPKSIKLFKAVLSNSKTVIWNGPTGMFEYSPFDKSTKEFAKYIVETKLISIVCGGDTAAALKKTKYKEKMTYVSTGGGASLQLLAGKKLPAIESLK